MRGRAPTLHPFSLPLWKEDGGERREERMGERTRETIYGTSRNYHGQQYEVVAVVIAGAVVVAIVVAGWICESETITDR